MPSGVFHFGEYRLNCSQFELLRKGRSVRLERKPMELLILLASKRGELVSREEITEHLWGREVFVDAERGINTAVRKVRYVLRDDPERPRFIQTVMGKGYRFSGAIEEAAQEVPPPDLREGNYPETETSKNTADVPAIREQAGLANRDKARDAGGRGFSARLAATGMALVLAAVILLVGVRESSSHSANRAALVQVHSLAVLPLKNNSGDPAQDYFADGMTDELTTMLAKHSTLRIVPESSAMQYRGADKPTREIAQELRADGVLVGSVNRSGGKVHMTLRLIQENLQRPSDKPVWSESYVRNVTDAVLLPGEVAMAIAGKTNSVVAGPAPERYVNPEAHDAYLHGRYLWVAGRNNDAGQYFLKAAALQPDYALAWSGVADYYGLGLVTGVMDPREVRKPFESAAEKGVELNPTLAQTHLSLCAALFFSRWDMSGADQECQRAIDLDPKFAEAYHLRAKVLIALNRDQEAIASQKKAMELDPFARPWALAYIYMLARQYDAAITEANQRMESSPHNAGILLVLSAAYRCNRMYAEGLKAREESLAARDDKADAESIQREFQRSGRLGVVRWDLGSLQRAAQMHYVSPMDMALDYAQLGDRERTLSLLEEAYRQHSPMLLTHLQSDSAYDFLHGSARYRALIEKIGLPLEQ